MSSHFNQIVITGAGLATPLGTNCRSTWQAVLQGRCEMGPLGAMESPLPEGADGGQAPGLPADFFPELPRESRYLRHAIDQAMRDAGIDRESGCAPDRRGIILGTTLHGMRSAGRFLRSNDYSHLKDFLSGAVLRNVASDLGFEGCALTTCSACSSSLGAIALGVTMLRSGRLDLVIAGGYDTISEYAYGGFSSLRLLAPGPLRPFARDRQGMKLSEGYGIVVLERAEDAARRGRKPLATVLGFGESADAHHLTQPHPEGDGAARAMRQAMQDAGLDPEAIHLIAAHATGTPDNDAGESAALTRVFGRHLPEVPVVAFKSHLGHTLGGAGAVELILSAMALRDQVIPACANVTRDDVEFAGLNLSTGDSRTAPVRATLNTSLGFGGANTCVILARDRTPNPPAAPPPSRETHEVLITGIGVVLPGVIGADAFERRLDEPVEPPQRDTGAVMESEIAGYLNARRVRRMSDYVKMSLAATVLALRDAGVDDITAFCETSAAILGTTHGSTGYSETYYRQIVREGLGAANPMLFAEGVPNAAAAHLSLMLSLKGPCQTVIGSRTAGLDALRLASARIAAGEWQRAIVGAAEEYSPLVNAAYAHWGLYGKQGFAAGAGAVSFVLESRSSAESRKARARGRVLDALGSLSEPKHCGRVVRRILNRFGRPNTVLTSANHTWIDRAERMGIGSGRGNVWSPYGHVAECFSVLPLAGIAAAMLTSKFATGRLASIATDYSGGVSGVLVERI